MDENISGCSSNGHEDGAGTGWAKDHWTSGLVKALLLGVGQMWRHTKVPQRYRGWAGSFWIKKEESWVREHKAQEIFIYVVIFPRMAHPFIQAYRNGETLTVHELQVPQGLPSPLRWGGSFFMKIQGPGSCPMLSQTPKRHLSPQGLRASPPLECAGNKQPSAFTFHM